MRHPKTGMMAAVMCLFTALGIFACGGGPSPALPEAKALIDEYEGVVDTYLSKMKTLKASNDNAGLSKVSKELNEQMGAYTRKWREVSGKLKPEEAKELADRLSQLNGRIIASFARG